MECRRNRARSDGSGETGDAAEGEVACLQASLCIDAYLLLHIKPQFLLVLMKMYMMLVVESLPLSR